MRFRLPNVFNNGRNGTVFYWEKWQYHQTECNRGVLWRFNSIFQFMDDVCLSPTRCRLPGAGGRQLTAWCQP